VKPEDGDGDKFDAVLRQLAVVVFYFKFVAEEAREAVNHDIEGGRLSGGGLYHPLKLRAAVFGGAVARLHECFDELVAARITIGFALALLVGDRHVMVGLTGVETRR
jgi:hypothetical protein